MFDLKFTWDPKKSQVNIKKHGVSFEEARTVFYDENAIEFYDDTHSENEDRFLMLGISSGLRLLLVCYCYLEKAETIRIISARKATKNESKYYWRR